MTIMAANLIPEGVLANDVVGEREHVQEILRNAGLLVEPDAATLASAAQSTLTLNDASELLSRGTGPSFSQQVDDERGSRR
jgi:hypothetical protein